MGWQTMDVEAWINFSPLLQTKLHYLMITQEMKISEDGKLKMGNLKATTGDV